MPFIPDDLLTDLMADASTANRKKLQAIAKGTQAVRCESQYCRGTIIGYLVHVGLPQEHVEAVPSGRPGCALLSFRKRYDGHWGFACECGNDSRISAQEEGIIGSRPPSADDIAEILERVRHEPTEPVTRDGRQHVDGFSIGAAA